ncbi:MAG: hypothetical protein IJT20_02220 [Synergistaceae bacterium]|nr:hypothetical protein [Synergistaceae bacterium]
MTEHTFSIVFFFVNYLIVHFELPLQIPEPAISLQTEEGQTFGVLKALAPEDVLEIYKLAY